MCMIETLLKNAGFTCDITVDRDIVECRIYKNGVFVERIGCWGYKAVMHFVKEFINKKSI